MRPLGLIIVAVAIVLYRAAFRGRALTDIPGDANDILVALTQGDTDAALEAFNRAGTLSITGEESETGSVAGGQGGTVGGSTLIDRMQSLGAYAMGNGGGYRLGASGPKWYDCSGLVWRAMTQTGLYSGPRFVTATFAVQARNSVKEVSAPSRGTLGLWRKNGLGHIAVFLDGSNTYSAKNPRIGIGEAPASAFTAVYGKPRYFDIGKPGATTAPKGTGGTSTGGW